MNEEKMPKKRMKTSKRINPIINNNNNNNSNTKNMVKPKIPIRNTPAEIAKMNLSCLSLFTIYDSMALKRIVGIDRYKNMNQSGRTTFMFK
jgi:hypothetical protein